MPINYEAAKTLIKGLVQKMKSFRGNWEQNDPTADDYIKNRPFYTEGEKETVIIPEMTVSISNNVIVAYSPIVPFEIGQTYSVLWNGDSYSCVASEVDGVAALGDFDFSNLPFCIAVNEDLFGGAYIASPVDGDYTVLVTSVVSEVHKIDKKYLPNMYYLSYKENQNLTYEQQETALLNMGDAFYDGVYNIANGQKFVKYTSQSLSASQQATARNNIGAASSSEVSTAVSNATSDVLRYSKQTLSDNQKETARNNIGCLEESDLADVALSGDFNELDNIPCGYNYIDTERGLIPQPTSASGTVYFIKKTFGILVIQEYEKYYIPVKRWYGKPKVYRTKTETVYVLGNAALIGELDESNRTDIESYDWIDTGEDFCHAVYTQTGTTKAITIAREQNGISGYLYKRDEELVQLDEKFIPDTISRTDHTHEDYALKTDILSPDLSQNDPEAADYVKGVIRQESLPEGYPYKESTKRWVVVQEEIDANIENTGYGIYEKFSSSVMTGFCIGDVLRITYDGVVYEDEVKTYVNNSGHICGYVGNPALAEDGYSGEVQDYPFCLQGFPFPDSNKFTYAYGEVGVHTVMVEKLTEVETITPMSEEFLPPEAAHVSTATVGQTIVVKAVDDTGKPTEWEAVDMNVLTSPSGKKFQITVDDNGVLIVTEVV